MTAAPESAVAPDVQALASQYPDYVAALTRKWIVLKRGRIQPSTVPA